MLEALGKKPGDKPCNTIDTLVGARTELKGDLVFSGGLRVDGRIEGNVSSNGEGNSVLVVSENAVITGDVNVPHVVVNGRIRGNVTASERVELQAKATVEGDVGYKILEVQAGAVVIGAMRRMGERASVTPIKPAESAGAAAKT